MKILSWGSNSHGQLAQNSLEEQVLQPVSINSKCEAVFINGGGKHTVLLTTNGQTYTCGDNDKGQLGKELNIKLNYSFELLPCPYKITKVSCGWDFNLALTDNGDVLGWGSNSFGQLGLSVDKVSYSTSPLKVFDKKAIDIGTGLRHSGIITSDGLIFTSGSGRKGQLGFYVNNKVPNIIDKFIQVKEIKNCVEFSCGECHSVVKTNEGKVFSWGNNKFGQLGVDPTSIKLVNTPIQIEIPVEDKRKNSLHTGWAHNLILTEKGEIISWGRNDFGQLGDQRKEHWKPQIIQNLEKIKQINCGSHHCIALTESGNVFTWGWNEHGNCGDGTCENVKQPHKLKNIEKIRFIGSGAAHCFLALW